MEKETIEAYALGGIGLARGLYKELIEPNKEAVALGLGVVATGVALGYLLDRVT